MTIETTYSDARARFAELWDQAVSNREAIIVHRRGAEDLALIPADELASLLETAYLFRSPTNARELLEAYQRAICGEGEVTTIDDLRRELEDR